MVIFQVSHLATDGPGAITVIGERPRLQPPPLHGATRWDLLREDHRRRRQRGRELGQPLGDHAARGARDAGGDITYVCDGVKQITLDTEHAAVNLSLNGTAESPVAFIAYPGATVEVGNDELTFGFRHWLSGFGSTEYLGALEVLPQGPQRRHRGQHRLPGGGQPRERAHRQLAFGGDRGQWE